MRKAAAQTAKGGAPDPLALNSKFIDEGAHNLSFGDLSKFYGGLSKLVGAPAEQLVEGMQAEHC